MRKLEFFNRALLGMNTGIQDAHNLAWKLASVIKEIAPSSILSTYEAERKQVKKHCIKQNILITLSLKNMGFS